MRLIIFVFAIVCASNASLFNSRRITPFENKNHDAPVILTDFLKQGKVQDAKDAAEVDPTLFLGVKSYSGYVTVDELYNSNLFFWYFPTEKNSEDAPVVLWLQGGPGSTSMFGLFTENGPFGFTEDGEFLLREQSWHTKYNLVFIDNPAGTGWSFTDEGGYAQNQTKVGEGLWNGLQQFFTIFPELRDNEFYVSGESYGGKYIPAIAHTIHKNNPEAELKINLQGIAIGNGWTDPRNQIVVYGDYLYQLGIIDSNAREVFATSLKDIVALIDEEKYLDALDLFDELIFDGVGSFFYNVSGYVNPYNYLYAVDNSKADYYMSEFLQTPEIRTAIHVGNATFDNGAPVYENLSADILRSIAPWVADLICNYRVLIYNGQMDIIVAYSLTVNYLQQLDFCGSEEYKTAPRNIWYVGEDLAGYSKVAGNLTEVLVRNSGHMVPTNQPDWALDLITKFVENKPIV